MGNGPKIVILDGGGTIWYSMPVLWEHYQAAFSYFGLMQPQEFADKFPEKEVTHISSLRTFNSRRNIPKALLAMYFNSVSPRDILNQIDKGNNPEEHINNLIRKSWVSCSRFAFEKLSDQMGKFLIEALYNYDDTKYPLCDGVKEGLQCLCEREYTVTMISNRQFDSVMTILRNLGVVQYFNHVEAPRGTSEPTTKPINRIIERYGIEETELWKAAFIGDSNLDIASAHEFKLLSIAVLTGMGNKTVLRLENPVEIVKDLVEAAEYLDKAKGNWLEIYADHKAAL